MKLKEYLKNLNEQVAKDPSLLELDLIYSSDDEGNHFNRVYFTASVGFCDGEDFRDMESIEETFSKLDKDYVKVICLN